MTPEDITNRFTFHPADSAVKRSAHEHVRSRCLYLAGILNEDLPEGREKSTAITKLEEVMFWANAAIARNNNSVQIENYKAGSPEDAAARMRFGFDVGTVT